MKTKLLLGLGIVALIATAAAAQPGSRVELRDVLLDPRRAAFFDVLARMGAKVERRDVVRLRELLKQRRQNGKDQPDADGIEDNGSKYDDKWVLHGEWCGHCTLR